MEKFNNEFLSETNDNYPKITTLFALNITNETVPFYLTLGVRPDWVQDVKNILEHSGFKWSYTPGNTNQGVVYIPAQSWFYYTPPANKGLNGNFSVGAAPSACPSKAFPNGINTGEFYLNVQDGGWECINISCVNGVNANLQFRMGGGTSNWGVNNTAPFLKEFGNKRLGHNTGIPGVYPTGCTTCTGGQSPCTINPLPSDKPNASDICNIQRSGRGGNVVFTYVGKL